MDERMAQDDLPFAPASERNRQPILDALEPRMPASGRLLEIGAGTGQHAVFMAPRFPGLAWLPTDRDVVLDGLGGIEHRLLGEVADARPLGGKGLSRDVLLEAAIFRLERFASCLRQLRRH